MVRVIGFIVGLSLVAAAVLVGRVDGGRAPVGSSVTLSITPTGELAVSPSGVVLVAPDMRPGPEATAAEGRVLVRNQSAERLAVRIKANPSVPDLDDVVMLTLVPEAGAPTTVRLGDLRRWTGRQLVLASGESRSLTVRAWIPGGVTNGYGGRIAEVGLVMHAAHVA